MQKLVYWEIPSQDVNKDAAFFAELFGWRTEPSGEAYVSFHVDEGLGGGIQKVESPPDHGISVYIGVEDIPPTLAKAEALGAETLHPKTDIGEGWGYWADFRAPGGARIGLHAKR